MEDYKFKLEEALKKYNNFRTSNLLKKEEIKKSHEESCKAVAKETFEKYRSTFIDETLKTFISAIEESTNNSCNSKYFSKDVSYKLADANRDFYFDTYKYLKQYIEKELRKQLPNIPKMNLSVSCQSLDKIHGYEEGDWHAGRFVETGRDYFLSVHINLRF